MCVPNMQYRVCNWGLCYSVVDLWQPYHSVWIHPFKCVSINYLVLSSWIMKLTHINNVQYIYSKLHNYIYMSHTYSKSVHLHFYACDVAVGVQDSDRATQWTNLYPVQMLRKKIIICIHINWLLTQQTQHVCAVDRWVSAEMTCRGWTQLTVYQ